MSLHCRGSQGGWSITGRYLLTPDRKSIKPFYPNFNRKKKKGLALENYSLEAIEELINNWVEPDLYRELFPDKFGLVTVANEKLSKKQRISQLAADLGIFKLIPYLIGSVLLKTGKWLQDLVNSSKFFVF